MGTITILWGICLKELLFCIIFGAFFFRWSMELLFNMKAQHLRKLVSLWISPTHKVLQGVVTHGAKRFLYMKLSKWPHPGFISSLIASKWSWNVANSEAVTLDCMEDIDTLEIVKISESTLKSQDNESEICRGKYQYNNKAKSQFFTFLAIATARDSAQYLWH